VSEDSEQANSEPVNGFDPSNEHSKDQRFEEEVKEYEALKTYVSDLESNCRKMTQETKQLETESVALKEQTKVLNLVFSDLCVDESVFRNLLRSTGTPVRDIVFI